MHGKSCYNINVINNLNHNIPYAVFKIFNVQKFQKYFRTSSVLSTLTKS
jgi:hypothetical protein